MLRYCHLPHKNKRDIDKPMNQHEIEIKVWHFVKGFISFREARNAAVEKLKNLSSAPLDTPAVVRQRAVMEYIINSPFERVLYPDHKDSRESRRRLRAENLYALGRQEAEEFFAGKSYNDSRVIAREWLRTNGHAQGRYKDGYKQYINDQKWCPEKKDIACLESKDRMYRKYEQKYHKIFDATKKANWAEMANVLLDLNTGIRTMDATACRAVIKEITGISRHGGPRAKMGDKS